MSLTEAEFRGRSQEWTDATPSVHRGSPRLHVVNAVSASGTEIFALPDLEDEIGGLFVVIHPDGSNYTQVDVQYSAATLDSLAPGEAAVVRWKGNGWLSFKTSIKTPVVLPGVFFRPARDPLTATAATAIPDRYRGPWRIRRCEGEQPDDKFTYQDFSDLEGAGFQYVGDSTRMTVVRAAPNNPPTAVIPEPTTDDLRSQIDEATISLAGCPIKLVKCGDPGTELLVNEAFLDLYTTFTGCDCADIGAAVRFGENPDTWVIDAATSWGAVDVTRWTILFVWPGGCPMDDYIPGGEIQLHAQDFDVSNTMGTLISGIDLQASNGGIEVTPVQEGVGSFGELSDWKNDIDRLLLRKQAGGIATFDGYSDFGTLAYLLLGEEWRPQELTPGQSGQDAYGFSAAAGGWMHTGGPTGNVITDYQVDNAGAASVRTLPLTVDMDTLGDTIGFQAYCYLFGTTNNIRTGAVVPNTTLFGSTKYSNMMNRFDQHVTSNVNGACFWAFAARQGGGSIRCDDSINVLGSPTVNFRIADTAVRSTPSVTTTSSSMDVTVESTYDPGAQPATWDHVLVGRHSLTAGPTWFRQAMLAIKLNTPVVFPANTTSTQNTTVTFRMQSSV